MNYFSDIRNNIYIVGAYSSDNLARLSGQRGCHDTELKERAAIQLQDWRVCES